MNCPICTTTCEEMPELCPVCGWDFPVYASMNDDVKNLLEKRIQLNKETWLSLKEHEKKNASIKAELEINKKKLNNLEIRLQEKESEIKQFEPTKKEHDVLKMRLKDMEYLGQAPHYLFQDTGNERMIVKLKYNKNQLSFHSDSEVIIGVQLVFNTDIKSPNAFDSGSVSLYKEIKTNNSNINLKALNIKAGEYFISVNLINSFDSNPYFYEIDPKTIIKKISL